MLLLPPIEIFRQGTWDLLRDLEDPELKKLAEKLPDTILHSRADSTVRKYLGAFKRWKTWATERQISTIPVKDYHLALYLQFLADSTQSKSVIEEACNSVEWVHSTAGLSSPTVSPFVKATLEGLQRLLAKPTVKKAPVTPGDGQGCRKDWLPFRFEVGHSMPASICSASPSLYT